MTAKTPREKEKQKERTARKKVADRQVQAALKEERSIIDKFQLPGLKPPSDSRSSITETMIRSALFPAHAGRKQVDDAVLIWDRNWGRCDKRFLESSLPTCPVDATAFIGPNRRPVLFTDRDATRECFGMFHPDDLDVFMVCDSLDPDYPGNVVNNFSGERTKWPIKHWQPYIQGGEPPAEHVPPPPVTNQHKIFNMTGLEITGTELAAKMELPFLQRRLDPLLRFPEILEKHKTKGALVASLYAMSASAGSFTPWHVDATGEVHWLTVVDGEKWVYLLPPSEHNIEMYRKGEDEKVRADLQWLPDNCEETPVIRVILKAGQTLLIPSGYLHAVFSPVASLALAGAWVDEYNIESHTFWRKFEFDTKTLKVNRFPYFERICWLMADEWTKKLKAQTARTPKQVVLDRLKILHAFVEDQWKRRKGLAPGSGRTASASLPQHWRNSGHDKTVVDDLGQAISKMERRLAEEAVEVEVGEAEAPWELQGDEGTQCQQEAVTERREAPGKRTVGRQARERDETAGGRTKKDIRTYAGASARRATEETRKEGPRGAGAVARTDAARETSKTASETVARTRTTQPGIAPTASMPSAHRQQETHATSRTAKTIRQPTTTTQRSRRTDADTTMDEYMRKDPVRARRPATASLQAKPVRPLPTDELRPGERRRETIQEMTKTAKKLVRPAPPARATKTGQTMSGKQVTRTVKGVKSAMRPKQRKEIVVAPGKEQERLEIRMGKRKAPEDSSDASASKRQRERDDSVVLVGEGHLQGNPAPTPTNLPRWERDGSVVWDHGEHNGDWRALL